MVWLGLTRAGAAESGQLKPGEPFPDLKPFHLEGQDPGALPGRVVLVDFWASWCGPCKQSFPVLDKLARKYGARGLEIIGVSVDDLAQEKDRFLTQHPVSFSLVWDAEHKLVKRCAIKSMPTSFLLDCRGTVRFVHNGFYGEATEQELIRQIEELLPCPSPKAKP